LLNNNESATLPFSKKFHELNKALEEIYICSPYRVRTTSLVIGGKSFRRNAHIPAVVQSADGRMQHAEPACLCDEHLHCIVRTPMWKIQGVFSYRT
jgi:hypothetical protein